MYYKQRPQWVSPWLVVMSMAIPTYFFMNILKHKDESNMVSGFVGNGDNALLGALVWCLLPCRSSFC